jgi:hypothetical protein
MGLGTNLKVSGFKSCMAACMDPEILIYVTIITKPLLPAINIVPIILYYSMQVRVETQEITLWKHPPHYN